MEERERIETVPMGNGSKEELFEKGHPVIRELKSTVSYTHLTLPTNSRV